MEEQELAIIDWLTSFDMSSTEEVKSLSDLSDGYVLATILSRIAPSYFESNAIEPTNNPQIAGDNIKKIIGLIDGYYRFVLRKYIDTSTIHVDAIVNDKDPDEILNLLELVVGAAVMCNDPDARAEFIQQIFSLDHASQTFLKDLIQSVMSRAQDIGDDDDDGTGTDIGIGNHIGLGNSISIVGTGEGSAKESALEEAVIRSEEAVRHLREEQQRLLAIISELEGNNRNLILENEKLSNALQDLQSDKVASPNKGVLEHKAQALMTVQIELDEVKRELDMKIVENENLKSDLISSRRQWESSTEIIQKLTMENNQMADELDVARDKALKLAKAEASIEKYQQKLEEMTNLKKQNKELSGKLDQYLDQINQLESSNKGMTTLQRLVEQYKDKAVELEREKFEAVSACQMKEHEITNLKNELAAITEARNILEDETGSLRIELSQLQDNSIIGGHGASTLSDDLDSTESITSLKEKLKKLEFEVNTLRAASGSTDGSQPSGDVALLQVEVEDLKRIKKEREEYILGLRKTLAETQNDLQKANRVMQEAETNSVSAVAAKDAEQKLAQTNNTIRLLEERLKEHETTINKLEQDKSKLELYARKTLSTFRDKFMTSYQTLQAEKKASDDRVQALTEKIEANQETTRREERLLLSSMYELGMRIMDRKLQAQMQQRGGFGYIGNNDGNDMSGGVANLALSTNRQPMTPIKR